MSEIYAEVKSDINAIIDLSVDLEGPKEAVKKDKDGYYKNIPLAVLDKVSLNNTLYEYEYAKKALESPDSLLHHRIKDGTLTGEYGHPFVFGLPKEVALQRILTIDPDKESHHFRRLLIKKVPKIGYMFFGDLKPHGPYADYLEEKLENPNMNCAFSLRALTRDKRDPRGFIRRQIVKFVTFDGGVPAGGFIEASKRYKMKMAQQNLIDISQENVTYNINNYQTISVPVTEQAIMNMSENVALENVFTQYELHNILGYKKIRIRNKIIGTITDNKTVVLGEKLNKKVPTKNIKSTFHTFFNNF